MNTSLPIPRPVITVRRPKYSLLITLILAFIHPFLSVRDEPAALGYSARKYNGEID